LRVFAAGTNAPRCGRWKAARSDHGDAILGEDRLAAIDLFDRVQLREIIGICRNCTSLSTAGRLLFAASRTQKISANDADRLRKYLARFGLEWGMVTSHD
jgi:transcriptional regulatory protein RtcR